MPSTLLAHASTSPTTSAPERHLRDIAIYGSEYRDVVKLVDAINRHRPQWRLRGFIDDRPERQGASVLGVPVLGDRTRLARLAAEGTQFFCNVSGKVADVKAVAAVLAVIVVPLRQSVQARRSGLGRQPRIGQGHSRPRSWCAALPDGGAGCSR